MNFLISMKQSPLIIFWNGVFVCICMHLGFESWVIYRFTILYEDSLNRNFGNGDIYIVVSMYIGRFILWLHPSCLIFENGSRFGGSQTVHYGRFWIYCLTMIFNILLKFRMAGHSVHFTVPARIQIRQLPWMTKGTGAETAWIVESKCFHNAGYMSLSNVWLFGLTIICVGVYDMLFLNFILQQILDSTVVALHSRSGGSEPSAGLWHSTLTNCNSSLGMGCNGTKTPGVQTKQKVNMQNYTPSHYTHQQTSSFVTT